MYRFSNLLLLFAIVACSPRQEVIEHSFRVYEEDGVRISVTSMVPKFDGQLIRFEEKLRLHQDDNRPDSLLKRASLYTMGSDGRFYVPDLGSGRIAVYDDSGEYLHSIGRRGQGPGEFQGLIEMYLMNGFVLARDFMLRRISLFATDGAFIRQYSQPDPSVSTYRLYPLPNGHLIYRWTEYESIGRETTSQKDAIVIFTAFGDTISQIDGESWSPGKQVFVDRLGSTATHYFGPRSNVSYHPGFGILFHTNQEPTLKWYNLDGALSRELRLELTPEPVIDDERRGIHQLLQNNVNQAQNDNWRSLHEEIKRYVVIPENKTYWANVTVDDSGFHWLSRHPDYTSPNPEQEPPRFMLLSPEGEYLGDVQFPVYSSWISQGHLLSFSENEETGEVYYTVYRMIPMVDGLDYPQ